jgi:hypothetical protein
MLSALIYPFQRSNFGGFGIGVGSVIGLSLLAYVIPFRIVSVALMFLSFGICAVLFEKTLASSLEGEPAVRDWVVAQSEIGDSILMLLSVVASAFWPLLVVMLISGVNGFLTSTFGPILELVFRNPFGAIGAPAPSWAWPALIAAGVWGLFALPVIMTAWAYFKTPRILDPIFIAVHAGRSGASYWGAFSVLVLLAAMVISYGFLPAGTPPLVASSFGWFLFAYVGVVASRVCGLVYHRSADRWGWRDAVRSGL